MFDVGWTEMLVIAVVMIVVVGPKDLPRMLRTFGKTTSKLRSMAGDFQKQFNEALKEAELDDVKKSVDQLRSLNPTNEIKKHINPFEKAAADVRAGLESLKPAPKPSVPAATTDAISAEPLKNGAAPLVDTAATAEPEIRVAGGPDKMPEPVVPSMPQNGIDAAARSAVEETPVQPLAEPKKRVTKPRAAKVVASPAESLAEGEAKPAKRVRKPAAKKTEAST